MSTIALLSAGISLCGVALSFLAAWTAPRFSARQTARKEARQEAASIVESVITDRRELTQEWQQWAQNLTERNRVLQELVNRYSTEMTEFKAHMESVIHAKDVQIATLTGQVAALKIDLELERGKNLRLTARVGELEARSDARRAAGQEGGGA